MNNSFKNITSCFHHIAPRAALGLVSTGLCLTFLVLPAQANIGPNKGEKAGSRQLLLVSSDIRSRIQRATRLYLEIAASSRVDKATNNLRRELNAIDVQFVAIAPLVTGKEENKVFIRLQTKYVNWRPLLAKAYSKQEGDYIYSISEEMLATSQKLVQLAEQKNDSELAFAVDLSSRVIAQTERIAKALMQCSLTQSRSSLVDLEIWRKEHATGLAQLSELKINDEYVQNNLKLSATLNGVYGAYVDQALRRNQCDSTESVMRSSDTMWSVLRATQQRYEQRFTITPVRQS